MTATGEIRYLVLTDRAAPYLLARVRWPDVAQAITARCPDWLDDPGLFDLPYDPNSVAVSFAQAASVAAGWGRQLSDEPAENAPSFIRRMPANWSDLAPVERRALGLESFMSWRVSGRRLRRLRSAQVQAGAPEPALARAGGRGAMLGADGSYAAAISAPDSDDTVILGPEHAGSVATAERREVRLDVDGRAHIAAGQGTISAALVDLSEGGVRCVLPEGSPVPPPGTALDGPFVLEAEVTTTPRICLAVPGQVRWNLRIRAGMHFGVAFEELDDGQTQGLQRFLVAAGSKRGTR